MDSRSDRRRFPRVPLQVEVEVRGAAPRSRYYWAEDISEGGLRLRQAHVPNFSPVEVRFVLPSLHQETHLNGTVAWRRVSATGVSFVHLSDDQRSLLRSYVAGHTAAS